MAVTYTRQRINVTGKHDKFGEKGNAAWCTKALGGSTPNVKAVIKLYIGQKVRRPLARRRLRTNAQKNWSSRWAAIDEHGVGVKQINTLLSCRSFFLTYPTLLIVHIAIFIIRINYRTYYWNQCRTRKNFTVYEKLRQMAKFPDYQNQIFLYNWNFTSDRNLVRFYIFRNSEYSNEIHQNLPWNIFR